MRVRDKREAIDHHDPGQPFKDLATGLRGRQAEGEHEDDDGDDDGPHGKAQAHPIGGPLPRRRTQLPRDFGQDRHLARRQTSSILRPSESWPDWESLSPSTLILNVCFLPR